MSFLLQRETIIGLAILGAIIGTTGSLLLRRKSSDGAGAARLILWTGYSITWGSVILFIVAGFVGE